jgi:hypothetical protein
MPSEILRRGESIDIWIAQLGVGYENYLHQKMSGKAVPNTVKPTEAELMQMWQQVKQNEDKNKHAGP